MFFFLKPTKEDKTHLTKNDFISNIPSYNRTSHRLPTYDLKNIEITNKHEFAKHFSAFLNEPLGEHNLLDIEVTKKLKHNAYKFIFTQHDKAIFLNSFEDVIKELNNQKKLTTKYNNLPIIIFHDYDSEIGAIKIKLGKFWSMFPQILDILDSKLHHDLLITSPDIKSGICVEIEGLDYSMTTWGF